MYEEEKLMLRDGKYTGESRNLERYMLVDRRPQASLERE
jgi:hypothetical protein